MHAIRRGRSTWARELTPHMVLTWPSSSPRSARHASTARRSSTGLLSETRPLRRLSTWISRKRHSNVTPHKTGAAKTAIVQQYCTVLQERKCVACQLIRCVSLVDINLPYEGTITSAGRESGEDVARSFCLKILN